MASEATGAKGHGKGSGKRGGGLDYMRRQAETTVPTPSLRLDGKVLEWFCINDVVMGGQSTASVAANSDGHLVFEGNVNTSGGGFASCRTRSDDSLGLGSCATGLRLRYVSDELSRHRYKVALSVGDMQSRSVSWQWELPVAEGRNSVIMRFCDLRASIHGQPQDGHVFDPATVTSFGINCSVFDMAGERAEQLEGGAFTFTLEGIDTVMDTALSKSSVGSWCCGR